MADDHRHNGASAAPLPFLRFGPRPDRTTCTGWQEWQLTRGLFVSAPRLSRAEFDALSPRGRSVHNLHRTATHVNMRLLETPMSAAVVEVMRDRIDNNALRFGPGTRDGLMITGGGYQGKTETVCEASADFEDFWKNLCRQVNPAALPGTRDLFAPVAYCQTPVRSTPMALCEAILDFYHAPYGRNLRGMIRNVRASIRAHGTSVLLLDDITRLKMHREDDQDTLDLIRDLMSLDVTLVLIGVNIPSSGLLREGWFDPRTQQWVLPALKEGRSYNPDASTQTERRFDLIELAPFDTTTSVGTTAFVDHLAGIEDQLRLFDAEPGILTGGDMPEYLYRRTHGVVGLLRRLIEDACTRAIRTGLETITTDLLETVTINLGNVPDRDPGAGEIPDIDLTPESTKRPPKKRKRVRNTVFDDPGTPAAAEA
ncbi:TniB family NTP-binding protein [Streptomyces incarnatus]